VAASAGLTAGLMKVPFRADFFDLASTATVITVSVAIAARSTSHRIRIHQAHVSAMESEREAKAARERALLAESAITMERLAASLSHELNTPIGVLKSSTETLVRGIRKHALFVDGNRLPNILDPLSGAIHESTARLSETVARIQRFANLDRSAVRLVDINQLVQDAVALMNPPSANQALVKLTLRPLPQVWCRPHGLSVAIASILNTALDSSVPATIDTYSEGANAVVRMAYCMPSPELQDEATPGFAVVAGRVRATGWDLFAARQLVSENCGELRISRPGGLEQVVTITLPNEGTPLDQVQRPAASAAVA
jgi:signal transduction histidine kinase